MSGVRILSRTFIEAGSKDPAFFVLEKFDQKMTKGKGKGLQFSDWCGMIKSK